MNKETWEEVIDFTEIDQIGVEIEKIISSLDSDD